MGWLVKRFHDIRSERSELKTVPPAAKLRLLVGRCNDTNQKAALRQHRARHRGLFRARGNG